MKGEDSMNVDKRKIKEMIKEDGIRRLQSEYNDISEEIADFCILSFCTFLLEPFCCLRFVSIFVNEESD